jgi:AcrR family transcriptional regulator
MAPAIFDDEKRNQVRIKLLENGFNSIKHFGMKKTSIEEVAKASGIAKGTFYNFFSSKEEFVAAIILYKREAFKQELNALINEAGGLTKDCIRKILRRMAFGDDNLYAYLRDEDLAVLTARAPKSMIPMEEDVKHTTEALLSLIRDKREDCDWQEVANYVKIMVLTVINRKMLLENAIERNIDGIISLIIKCIFDSKENEIN